MPATTPPSRPPLEPQLTGTEFKRWYWLKEELVDFTRQLGLRTSGSKVVLTERIAASLDGRTVVEPAPTPQRSTRQLQEPLTATTIIPAGQRCSQLLRGWFTEQIGPGFHFDAAMRDYFASATGTTTLDDAVKHWHSSRSETAKPIDPQFEYNRFTRQWHAEHPGGTRAELLQAWQNYRALPIDQRTKA